MDWVPVKLAAGGWGVCAEESTIAGHYTSQAAACQFEPSRFEAQEIVREQPAPCDLPEEIDFG